MKRGLFLNTEKAQCSIYESGVMVYKALKTSNEYHIDYCEIDPNHRVIPGGYDFYLFNYHYATMCWLKTKALKDLPGITICMVLEVYPGNPLILAPKNDFDAYMVLDPSEVSPNEMNIIYIFPRPLEVPEHIEPYVDRGVPVIGSFGMLGEGKGFQDVVRAVNKEFDKAIIRFNFPFGRWAIYDGDKIIQECKELAKPGIEVIITRDYMSKEELINWCSQNTLNVFLYNRNCPGLAATTDQAIASGRPLAVSDCNTFRHIHQYIVPYPNRSLKKSIEDSAYDVAQMQRAWNPKVFASAFSHMIDHYPDSTDIQPRDIVLQKRSDLWWYWMWVIAPWIVRTKKKIIKTPVLR